VLFDQGQGHFIRQLVPAGKYWFNAGVDAHALDARKRSNAGALTVKAGEQFLIVYLYSPFDRRPLLLPIRTSDVTLPPDLWLVPVADALPADFAQSFEKRITIEKDGQCEVTTFSPLPRFQARPETPAADAKVKNETMPCAEAQAISAK